MRPASRPSLAFGCSSSRKETCVQHQPDYMTIREFAAYMRLSSRTIDRLIAAGIPTVRVGRCRRIDRQSAIIWLQSNAPLRSPR